MDRNLKIIAGIIIIVLAIIGVFLIFGQSSNDYTENVAIDSAYKNATDNVVSIYSNVNKFIKGQGRISYDLNKGEIEYSAIPYVDSMKTSHKQMSEDITSLNKSIVNLKNSATTSDEKEYVKLLENCLNTSIVLFDIITHDKNLLIQLEDNEITWATWVYGNKMSKASYVGLLDEYTEFNSANEDLKDFIKSHTDFANNHGLNTTSS